MSFTFPSGSITDLYVIHKTVHVKLDNVLAIQFYDRQSAWPVFSVSSLHPVFYSTSQRAVTGVISFNMHYQNIFGVLLSIGACDVFSSSAYYIQQIRVQMLVKESMNTLVTANIDLKDVFITKPGFTLIPDQTPVQLISNFIQYDYIYSKTLTTPTSTGANPYD